MRGLTCLSRMAAGLGGCRLSFGLGIGYERDGLTAAGFAGRRRQAVCACGSRPPGMQAELYSIFPIRKKHWIFLSLLSVFPKI